MRLLRLVPFWLAFFVVSARAGGDLSVRVVKSEEARADVYVGDQLFTSYHYGLGLYKPVFHPLRSPAGNIVTRRYPLEVGVAGEHRDHWHHESVWFTYGDVNGVDFWAKKPASGREQSGESGRIRHSGFGRLESGKRGLLEASADWITPSGKVLLKQKMRVVFEADTGWRVMDLTIELTAQDEKVVFGDTKEGMFGIRVAPSLREDQTGRYLNASGQEGEAGVWGKRSPWVALRGRIGDEDLTLAIFNHPDSVEFPTYWHARGYGLFAVNPFGRKDFEQGSEPLQFALEAGQSALFRYRVLIHSGILSQPALQEQFQKFSQVPAGH